MDNKNTLASAMDKLHRFGEARDRKVDREVRAFAITDDEALAIIEYIRELEKEFE